MFARIKFVKFRYIFLFFFLMIINSIMNVVIGYTQIPTSNDKFTLQYSLENFLNGYNVISFGNAKMDIHCMGGVLIQGDFELNGSGFGDASNLPASFILGRAILKGPYSSRGSNNNAPLYLGSINIDNSYIDSDNKAKIGNIKFYSDIGVYISDDFFDFNKAYFIVKQSSSYLLQNSNILDENITGQINIPIGSKVVVPDINKISCINFIGENLETSDTTTVTVLNESVTMPEVRVNGLQPNVSETGQGTSLVWNFPKANSVVLPVQNWVGHVIAPDAKVSQSSGNYNGCIICKAFDSASEGHLYSYNGNMLIPNNLLNSGTQNYIGIHEEHIDDVQSTDNTDGYNTGVQNTNKVDEGKVSDIGIQNTDNIKEEYGTNLLNNDNNTISEYSTSSINNQNYNKMNDILLGDNKKIKSLEKLGKDNSANKNNLEKSEDENFITVSDDEVPRYSEYSSPNYNSYSGGDSNKAKSSRIMTGDKISTNTLLYLFMFSSLSCFLLTQWNCKYM